MSRENFQAFADGSMNALGQSILDCADDYMECNGKLDKIDSDNYHVYEFLEETPRTSLVAEIVNKLRENGWDIVRK